jgi:hypothetical protein
LSSQKNGKLFLDVVFVEYVVKQIKESLCGFHSLRSIDLKVHASESDFLDVKISFSKEREIFFNSVVLYIVDIELEELLLHDQSAFTQLNQ